MTDKTKQFLQKLKDSGHWNDDYDYSKVEYINIVSSVIVIDKKFNTEHLITASFLLKGVKCCAKNLKNGFLPFEEAREFAHKLKLKGEKQWKEYRKSGNKPYYIPTNPHKIYKNTGWISMGDWLGTNRIADQFRTNGIGDHLNGFLPFEDAREFVRYLNLKGEKQWREYCKSGNKPYNIPAKPDRTYKNTGWISMGNWLGTK